MKTGAKVTIGIIGIIAAGIMGFLISKYQLDAAKADKERIAARTEQGRAGTGKGGANAPGKALDASADEHSEEQGVMDKDEEETWDALMEVLDGMAETPDTKTTDLQSGDSEATLSETESSGPEDSEESQDQPEMEYHESYNTFISITRNIAQTKAEMTTMDEELERLVDEWKRSVRDPKNPTEEEEHLTNEMKTNPMWGEREELQSDFNSLANELISEVEAVAPGAIQTESQDYGDKGTSTIVRIDYNQIQSELGSAGERIGGHLSDFFADFQVESWEGGYEDK